MSGATSSPSPWSPPAWQRSVAWPRDQLQTSHATRRVAVLRLSNGGLSPLDRRSAPPLSEPARRAPAWNRADQKDPYYSLRVVDYCTREIILGGDTHVKSKLLRTVLALVVLSASLLVGSAGASPRSVDAREEASADRRLLDIGAHCLRRPPRFHLRPLARIVRPERAGQRQWRR